VNDQRDLTVVLKSRFPLVVIETHEEARRRGPFLDVDGATGLDAPRGVLLLGVQGSGKSLAAKAIAGNWSVLLLRLDFANALQQVLRRDRAQPAPGAVGGGRARRAAPRVGGRTDRAGRVTR
jgi:hypothetical protein